MDEQDPIKNRKLNFYLGFASLIFIMVSLMFGYVLLENESKQYDQTVNDIKEFSWSYIESVISEAYLKAKYSTRNIAEETISEIDEIYQDDNDRLTKDLDNMLLSNSREIRTEINPIEQILQDHIENNYLYNIERDNMDLFIIMKKYETENMLDNGFILLDFSEDCSTFGTNRSFRQEISMHFNEHLAVSALRDISNQLVPDIPSLVSVIGWQFLTPSDEEITISHFSLRHLKELYMKSNLDYNVLGSFEFLYPEYLKWKSDLAKRPTIVNGQFNPDSRQIILVQGFGLVNIINSNVKHTNALKQFKSVLDLAEHQHYANVRILFLMIFMHIMVFAIIFVSVIFIYNHSYVNVLKQLHRRRNERAGDTKKNA